MEDLVYNEIPNMDGIVIYSTGEQIRILPLQSSRVLPEELSRNVVVLTCETAHEGGGVCNVYLVGTSHASQESCREVEAVISYLKPQVVFLELCRRRVSMLHPHQCSKVPTMREMVEMLMNRDSIIDILFGWLVAKLTCKLEVFPGSEFRVANEEAKKYGAAVILGDRPIDITLSRMWAKMSLWDKVKLLISFGSQAFFFPTTEELAKMLKDMDDVDIYTHIIQEASKDFPALMDTLLHERDQFMSATLLRVAEGNQSVVAVVGKGHLRGIKKNWQQPVRLEELYEMPEQKQVSVLKTITSLGVVFAGVAIISSIYFAWMK